MIPHLAICNELYGRHFSEGFSIMTSIIINTNNQHLPFGADVQGGRYREDVRDQHHNGSGPVDCPDGNQVVLSKLKQQDENC